MRARRMTLAGVARMALRVSFAGDLGWDLPCAAADQTRLYAALLEVGAPPGVGPVGGRGLNALRIEKGYGGWGRDYSPEHWPRESGLDGLIEPEKSLLNRDARAAVAAKPARELLRPLEIDADGADASGGEPIFLPNGAPAGHVSSGAHGYTVGGSLALGDLAADAVGPGDLAHVAVVVALREARVLAAPAFNPDGARLRA